ncbi:MAG: ThaI family type II restriction endonuclease [Anaerolineales bacterium]|nr:ThaI family type II restriction endonuclease [Anaerolineales bacterium]
MEFSQSCELKCDMLFSHINWDGEGGLHYFTKDIQKSVLVEIG